MRAFVAFVVAVAVAVVSSARAAHFFEERECRYEWNIKDAYLICRGDAERGGCKSVRTLVCSKEILV